MYNQIHENKDKVKVGIFKETPFLPVCAAAKRAVEMARKALEAEGYEVVDVNFDPQDIAEAKQLLLNIIAAGSAPNIMEDFDKSGEALTLGNFTMKFLLYRGPIFRWLIARVMRGAGEPKAAVIAENIRTMSPEELRSVIKRRYEFTFEMSKKWQKLGVAAVISPIFPSPSFHDQHADDMGLMSEYIMLWNILNFPCGIVPVTKVQEDEQSFPVDRADHFTHLINETCKDSKGMPMAVQVISHNYEDEKCLAVMASIEKQINFRMEVAEDLREIKIGTNNQK
jgi:fatty acid amide hydrolase